MKIICIGRNYVEHIVELHNEKPEAPIIFMKPDTAMLLGNNPFYYPHFSQNVHHELEVLVKINKTGKCIDPKFVENYYDEMGLGIDFTARDLQEKLKMKGHPWELAKGFNGSAVISEFMSKTNFDVHNLNFSLKINEKEVQRGNTSYMIWSIHEIICYVSQFIMLKKGDIIFTGTPKGVGPVQMGDRLIGYLENKKMFDFDVK